MEKKLVELKRLSVPTELWCDYNIASKQLSKDSPAYKHFILSDVYLKSDYDKSRLESQLVTIGAYLESKPLLYNAMYAFTYFENYLHWEAVRVIVNKVENDDIFYIPMMEGLVGSSKIITELPNSCKIQYYTKNQTMNEITDVAISA